MIKKYLAQFVSKISPKLFYRIAYYHNRQRLLHLKQPRDLSEIWIKSVLDGKINERYYLADKFKVRKYVEDAGLSAILPQLYGVYDKASDLDFSQYPSRFALKLNFGAGMNIICLDKNMLDVDATKKQLDVWLGSPPYNLSERHYNLISRKIIVEEFIDDGNGGFPYDYKFMCINGHVFCILACSDRESGHGHFSPYDLEWNPLPQYDKGGTSSSIPRPANLEEMIKVAQQLCKGIDLVRVDLYSNGSKIWFGEMTLTAAGCIFHGWTQQALTDMGIFYYQTQKTDHK